MNTDHISFGGCVFNPLNELPMLKAYPYLKGIVPAEWQKDEKLDKLIRYMIMVYDPGSPLLRIEKDLAHRRNMAAEMAGFTDKDEEYLSAVFTMTHNFFAELVIAYLRRFARSKEFAAIVIVENCFWESAQKLMEPISGKDSKAELEAVQKKAVIKDELDKDIARLDKYYKTFFGEDEVLEKKARGRMSPEAIAKMSS